MEERGNAGSARLREIYRAINSNNLIYVLLFFKVGGWLTAKAS